MPSFDLKLDSFRHELRKRHIDVMIGHAKWAGRQVAKVWAKQNTDDREFYMQAAEITNQWLRRYGVQPELFQLARRVAHERIRAMVS